MDRVEEYLEGQLHQVVALERGVRARHGDDLGFLHQQVLGSVQSAPQQLEGPELLQTSVEKPNEEQQSLERDLAVNFNRSRIKLGFRVSQSCEGETLMVR